MKFNIFQETVRILIRLGADVNKTLSAGKDKKTPLMLAARKGYLDIVRALVQSGAAVESLGESVVELYTYCHMFI